MTAYIPYYDRGFKVQKIDTTAARLFHNSPAAMNRFTICYYGTLYNGENIYRTEAGVVAYINRDYQTEREQRIEPETINDWKEKRGC